MGSLDSRVIIVTRDNLFFTNARQPLANESMVSLVINVSTILEAENKLAVNKPNILIVDTDSVSVGNASQLRMLSGKYSVFVILTASNHSRALVFSEGESKDYLPKPFGDALSFSNSVMLKARPFVMKHTGRFGNAMMSIRDLTNIATPNHKVIFIAASTGGPEAFEKMLAQIPPNCPPILLVQHMPSGFTKLFADRLNHCFPMTVKEAQDGDLVRAGQVLVAPADKHMALEKQYDKLAVRCFVGVKVHAVMPAADILFESAAPIIKSNGIGVVLTGMGMDGAKGLMLMRNFGARTICQDEKTSVVYGMPKAAYDLGAVEYKLPIGEISPRMLALAGMR